MKKSSFFLILFLSFVAANAQNDSRHNVDASFGAGLHSFFTGAENANASHGMGLCLGAMYTFRISEHFEIGGGLSVGSMHSSAKFNFTIVETNKTVPGAMYAGTVTTKFQDWVEKQNIIYLGIPIELFYYYQSATELFRFGAGFQFNLPLLSMYKASDGSYYRTLYLSETDATYDDLPALGTFKADDKGRFDSNVGLGFILDAGVFFEQRENYTLYAGVYGMMGLSTMADAGVSDLFDEEYDYQGTPNSVYVSRTLPFEIGVKVAMRFGLPRQRH